MNRALALILVVLAVALAPAAALAQSTPFGPVPTPEPTVQGAGNEGDVSRTTLYLIALAALVGVVAIGYAISRDARSSLTAEDREALEREARGERAQPEGAVSKEARARAKKQRQKVKAARRARRHNR